MSVSSSREIEKVKFGSIQWRSCELQLMCNSEENFNKKVTATHGQRANDYKGKMLNICNRN